LYTDEERVLMLRELRCVGSVYICDDPGPYRAIDDINPDLYVKGVEYKGKLPEFQYCIDRGIGVRFLGEKIYGSTRIALQSGLLQST
jgi:bifunctional ADP-heptose synthase (sugar kinase/adenylyltransferase)